MNRRIFWACLAALLLILGGYLQSEVRAMRGSRGESWRTAAGADFAVYYVAAKIASGEGDGRLYAGSPNASITDASSAWIRVAHANGVVATTPYQYPPFFAVLMRPIAKLSLQNAFFLWRQLSTIFVLAAIWFSLLIARAKSRLPLFVIAAAATLASFPFIEMNAMGQVGGLMLLLWSAGAYAAQKNRPFASAFCFALGTIVKLTPALVVPLFLMRRQWKWAIAYTAWIALFMSISVWQLGWSNHMTFVTRVMPAMSSGAPSAANESLMNVVQTLAAGDAFRDSTRVAVVSQNVSRVGKVLSAGLLALLLLAFYRNRRDLGYEAAMVALASLLVSPVSWRHHYVLAALPIVVLWNSRHSLNAPLLAAATVLIGTPFTHAIVQLAPSPIVRVVFSMTMPAAALCILWQADAQRTLDRSRRLVLRLQYGHRSGRLAEL